ncbi:SOS response-associated peptidase family protein [Paraburkholderia phenoliruptrix]|uniref:SOS response-associated peptidase family protein n=1 Tax=Paraburkholderia phenoliruptrix TaxID=252970 RepID=UPI001C6DD90D|nr:SOS response-associated peptidase family protein [Paraburkholderia phenoliruptrix]MBW9104839.1 SOS response-associated peptidase family protein [Paraburkholderia phenoliruptrix]MBW9131865.1 SOS response-associated peptidase family protein [Paraburkholderia ginsengiterrae]
MCYSAQIQADYRKFVRMFGATLSIREFAQLFFERAEGARAKLPKAMEDAFADPQTDAEREIRASIERFNAQETARLEQELFTHRARLAQAERSLQGKVTKKAAESRRIATEKIQWTLGRLDDLRRTEAQARDSRIFPGHYAPVMVMENGARVVKPMRYQCRIAGKPASHDARYPGTYNARRDSLEGFWKPLFGYSHGVLVVNAFYENVSRAKMEGRVLAEGEEDENVVLEFRPEPPHDMLVACLWSHWSAPGEPDLLSFAVITDEPPPEVAAAGHDRCLVPIKHENLDAWLNPDSSNLAALHAILEDRDRPYYEHRLAA